VRYVAFALVALLAAALIFINATCEAGISGKAYVDEAVPAILRSWDASELLTRATDELRQEMARGEFDASFRRTSRALGPMSEYKGSTGSVKLEFNVPQGRGATGFFAAEATFVRGSAKIEVVTVDRGAGWQIAGFRVQPH